MDEQMDLQTHLIKKDEKGEKGDGDNSKVLQRQQSDHNLIQSQFKKDSVFGFYYYDKKVDEYIATHQYGIAKAKQ